MSDKPSPIERYVAQWKPNKRRIAKLEADYEKAKAEGHYALMSILACSIADAMRPPQNLPIKWPNDKPRPRRRTGARKRA